MAGEVYFQWQNDVLRKSIYPLREMKLRDFLVYFRDIELWAEYKNKDIKGEVAAYHAQKKAAVEKAVRSYFQYRDYFMTEDVRADYLKKFGAVDEEALASIQNFHKTFRTFLPKYTNPRHETYFVSQQVLFWQNHRKEYLKKVAAKQRRVSVMKAQTPPHPNVPKEEQELAKMQMPAFAMVDEELNRLYAFVGVSSRIEKRKIEIAKTVDEAEKAVRAAMTSLDQLKPQIEKQEALRKTTSDELARLKSPPDLASAKSYFASPDLSASLRTRYPNAGQPLLETVGKFRKDMNDQLGFSKSDPSRLTVIKNTLFNLQQYRNSVQKEILKHETDLRNMGPAWKNKAERETLRDNLRDVSLKVVDEELRRLADYQSAFENSIRSKEETARLVKAKEDALAALNETLSRLNGEAKALRERIDSFDDILIVTDDKRLSDYVPDPNKPVSVKDIVQLKSDEYKMSLADLDHHQLLELVVKKFRENPNRYPRWLQYMVIHFSGMRYASAHGSWADPRDLLANLQTSAMEKEIKRLDDDAMEALCREKLECYAPTAPLADVSAGQKPNLALAADEDGKDRIAQHVRRLKRALEVDSPSLQRNALVGLRIDEGSYEVDAMSQAEVYEALLGYKDILPEPIWKEIVRLTELRLTQVKDVNWEKAAQGGMGISSPQDQEFRRLLEDWKKKFITGWREEHDRTDQLIVTRAVCNEVAEHIQHLRGNTPPGGLTSKPGWYQGLEKKDPRSYLVKPEGEQDFKAGASILWLRFVSKEPNEWQMAHSIATKKGGYGLLPPTFLGKRTSSPGTTTPWTYDIGDPIRRSRTFANPDKSLVRQSEWLRWIHEATVVETAETAEGKVVLTFETALPSDDPRLSSIGVFRHRLESLLMDGEEDTYNRCFVGFTPEGTLPEENLKHMLDWDKVLHRPVQ